MGAICCAATTVRLGKMQVLVLAHEERLAELAEAMDRVHMSTCLRFALRMRNQAQNECSGADRMQPHAFFDGFVARCVHNVGGCPPSHEIALCTRGP